MKLKLNWKALGSGVYESKNGIRVHCGGLLVRTPCKSFISANEEINRSLYWKCWCIMGRNNRRAMMLFAESLPIVKECKDANTIGLAGVYLNRHQQLTRCEKNEHISTLA